MHIINHVNILGRFFKDRLKAGTAGMVLLGLVLTMIIFAIVGVAIVKMFSSSSINEVLANLAHKAEYIAESGYRYAASQYRNFESGDDKDGILDDLNGNTYPSASDNSRFTLHTKSYFYEYNNTNKVTAFAELPDGISDHTGTGKVAVTVDGILSKIMEYQSYSVLGNQITFSAGSALNLDAWPTTGSANRIFPAASPNSAQSSILGTNLILSNSNNDLSLLPPEKGTFRIFDEDKYLKYNDLLQYEKLNGTTLEGVSRIHGTTTQIDIAATDYIVFQRFVELESVGSVGDDTSNIFSSRTISYHVPIEAFSGGATGPGDDLGQGKEDIFNSADVAKLVNDPKFAVLPGLKQFEAVIQATGTNVNDTDNSITNDGAVSFKFPNGIYNVHVNINWWRFADLGLGLNFDQAYKVQANTLSYDLQVKARVWKQMDHVMTGISFRVNNNDTGNNGNSYYGASLFFSKPGAEDTIPPWLGLPGTGGLADLDKDTDEGETRVYAVLWKRVNGTISLLHAEDITAVTDSNGNSIFNPRENDLYMIDWATIVVRIEESGSGDSKTQDIKVQVYSKDDYNLSEFTWPTKSDWSSPIINEPNENSLRTVNGSNDLNSIPRVYPDGSGNYDEDCEACVDCVGTCGRPEIGVHVFADSDPDQKLYLDDFAVRLLGGGDAPGGLVGFQQ